MCAREHPPDDDRQPPRGLADALSRWDTEQGWMRSMPGREADSTEHVPSPESTPGRPSPPADQRGPAPPPAVDSWDAVVPREPQPPRSADPWAPVAESEQELWTPPDDTVYRRVRSREPTLPERWPSEASATSRTGPAPDTHAASGREPESTGGRDESGGSVSDTNRGAGSVRLDRVVVDDRPSRTVVGGPAPVRGSGGTPVRPRGRGVGARWAALVWREPRSGDLRVPWLRHAGGVRTT